MTYYRVEVTNALLWPNGVDAIVRTVRHLTGRELDRVLSRTDKLSPRVLTELTSREYDEASWNWEVWAEQMAERGNATRRYTRLEAYQNAHPWHGPEPMPQGWGAGATGDDDDIPF